MCRIDYPFRVGVMASLMIVISMFCVSCAPRSRSTEGVSALGLTPQDWASLSQPGASHKLLQAFVGEWEVAITFWSSPESAGQSSSGHSKIVWVLGDRFLQENFRGNVAGESFDGMGLIGFDNGAREFKTVWLDSLNTAIAVASGKYDLETHQFDLTSEVYDPLRGGIKQVRSSLRLTSPDAYTFTMYDESSSGKRFKSLEMSYSRL